jgi:hypothetical protein
MKHKYQKLFWVWFGLAIAYAVFMVFGAVLAFSRTLDHFYQFSISFLWFFIYFPIGLFFFDLRWMERMSLKIRGVLSFEEYFDIKRSLELTLTTQDRDYVKEKLGKDASRAFLNNLYKSQKIPASRWLLIVLAIVTCLLFIFFRIIHEFLPISTSLYLLSGALNLITGTWFVATQAKPIKNRFLFVKKVDELVFSHTEGWV